MTNELARTLAAHPHFRWAAGMSSVWSQKPEHGGNRMTFRAGDGRPYTDPWFDPVRGRWNCDGPDLADAGTAGCLLSLLDNAAPDALPVIGRSESGWTIFVTVGGLRRHFSGPSLGSAAASALLACLPTPTETK